MFSTKKLEFEIQIAHYTLLDLLRSASRALNTFFLSPYRALYFFAPNGNTSLTFVRYYWH